MRHVGNFLRGIIDERRLVQAKLADDIGITPAYLSLILKKDSVDAALLERICAALSISPMVFYDHAPVPVTQVHNEANSLVGNSTVKVGLDASELKLLLDEKDRLLAEKERTIQILLGTYTPSATGTNSEH